MSDKRIPVSGPWITAREIEYVTDAVTNAWYGDANVYHGRFERAFADYIGSKFAVALPSCTSAIHLALAARGIGPGDEVIVPELTWIASAAPISYIGATPVFADVDAVTWCMSPESVERLITPRTRAVIPVDLYGGMPAMERLRSIADRHGLFLLEDAAEAFGSELHGRKAGSWGDCGVFSFHGSKTMTTGEGGMLVTCDEALFQRVVFLRDHGRNPGDTMFRNEEVAFKYKMSALQAALGLAQTERAGELVDYKRRIFEWYRDRLSSIQGITLNAEPPGTRNSFWMVTALADKAYGLTKERLVTAMHATGVDCRPFFSPLSSLRAYEGVPSAQIARQQNCVSYALSPFGINLPSGYDMTQARVETVCAAFTRVLADAHARTERAA